MALELVKLDSATLPGIADAIRAKTGGTELLLPSEMAAAIEAIPTGGALPELTTPAEVGHVLAGKEYIDSAGTKGIGTLVIMDTVQDSSAEGVDGSGLSVHLVSIVDNSTLRLDLPEPNLASSNIKTGKSIFGVAGSAKTLRVETGTITPAEDVTDITIPAPFDGYCALLLIAADRAALEAKGTFGIYDVRVMAAHNTNVGHLGITNRYNGTGYSAATKTPTAAENGNIYLGGTDGRYYRAGIVYNYYVYYWGDT